MAKTISILLVEDNPADVDLTRESLAESDLPNELHVATNGVDALAFLGQEGRFWNATRPDMVILDLNLPGLDGRQVLGRMKKDEALRTIPVIVFTSSHADEDVVRCYQLQASAYVTKPMDLDGFRKIIRGIEHFWLSVVRYPQ